MANALSIKRTMIDKANTRIVIYVSAAAFIFVFSVVATKTLISQASYQNRVISAKRKDVNQLKSDLTATSELKNSYNAFVSASSAQNIIGGNPSGTGTQDGDNAKIVLDALPSSYDFPGLATSLENLLSNLNGVKISGITGSDDELNQAANQTSSVPQPVAMPFTVATSSDYAGVQSVVSVFERSIRPVQIQSLQLSGAGTSLTLTLSAQTYYQPAKALNFTQEVVK